MSYSIHGFCRFNLQGLLHLLVWSVLFMKPVSTPPVSLIHLNHTLIFSLIKKIAKMEVKSSVPWRIMGWDFYINWVRAQLLLNYCKMQVTCWSNIKQQCFNVTQIFQLVCFWGKFHLNRWFLYWKLLLWKDSFRREIMLLANCCFSWASFSFQDVSLRQCRFSTPF